MGLPGWLLNGMKVPWHVVFFFLLLLLRSNGTKSNLMRSIFVTVIVIIAKVLYWKLLDTSSFQSSQQLTTALSVGFERHLWRFYRHGSTYVLIYSWENIMKEKMGKGASEISSYTKFQAWSLKNIASLHQDISLVIVFFFSLKQT